MKRLLPVLLFPLCAGAAAAETVRCLDAAGKTVYADSGDAQKYRNCRPVRSELNIVAPQPGAQTRAQSPAAQPRADGAAQANLKALEQRLEAAQKALAEQEAIRTGDERNYQRVLDRLKPYQDAVAAAQLQLERARREAR